MTQTGAETRTETGTGTWAVAGSVACVGEALVVLAPPPGRTLQDADRLDVGVAGAELNVAIHLARLGQPARFVGVVGDDAFGRRVVAAAAAEGVDTTGARVRGGWPTGFYFKEQTGQGPAVTYHRAGSAAATFPAAPSEVLTPGVEHVHLSGVTAALNLASRQACRTLLRQAAGTAGVSFDVNYRSALWHPRDAGPALADLAVLADLVFVGLDEAHAVWGCADVSDVRRLLPDVAELVVKDASRPVTVFRGSDPAIQVAPPPATVVEPVGAGDAFAAGYLAGRRLGAPIEASARAGHALAAHVMATTSDQGPADPARYARIADDIRHSVRLPRRLLGG